MLQKFLDRWRERVATVMQSYSREVVPGLDRSQSFEDWQAKNGKRLTQVSPTQGRITSSRAARDRGLQVVFDRLDT
ncbi:MAG TPA: hypothetical protein VJM75_10320 [Acidimicrobiales bacterium]|nr:hypothetical protein [Acidimicrobiales bacterium]